MTSERLKANTPKRWADPAPEMTYLKYFFLLVLVFFAITTAAFIVWYLLQPLEAMVFIRTLNEFVFGKTPYN